MGTLDDDRSQSKSVADEDATTAAEHADLLDPREEQQDIWAQAEGYTPLADIQYSSLMVAMGPSDSEDDNDDNNNNNEDGRGNEDYLRTVRGAFFVDASDFSAMSEDKEQDDIDWNTSTDTVARMPDSCIDDDLDFHSIANRTLSLLDEEYEKTLKGERRRTPPPTQPPSWDQETICRDYVSSVVDEEVQGGNESRCALTQDEDLKVIGAAFDERKKVALVHGFVADWDNLPSISALTAGSSSEEATISGSMDTDAVRKVVQSLSKNADNPFQKKFAEWQERQVSLPPTHGLIPTTPYAAFRRTTEKAKHASTTLSRSATMAEAMQRLRDKNILSLDAPTLLVDVVGVDHVECESVLRIQSTFRPIIRWIGSWKGCKFQHVHLRLIGRDLSSNDSIPLDSSIDLLTPKTATILQSAVATYHSGIYHTWLAELNNEKESSLASPHLAIAYNAGIWGYNEWEGTIRYLCERRDAPAIPFVVTAYTLEECQEDFDVFQTATEGKGCSQILWNAEMNPFGSKTIRETKSRSNEYRENAAWQAWLLGGSS